MLLKEVVFLLESLIYKITIPGKIRKNYEDVKNYLDRNCYLGYNFENKIRELQSINQISATELAGIRGQCIDFVVKLIKEIKNRLPDNIELLGKN